MVKAAFRSFMVVLWTLGIARIAVASPVTQAESGGAMDLTTVAIVTVVALLVAVIVGGAIVAALAAGVSRFLRRNMPSAEAMAKLDAKQLPAPSQPRKPIVISPNWEPFVIAAGGFVAVYILAALFVRVPSAQSEANGQTNGEGPGPAATSAVLPTTGDYEQIVAELPEGNADSGAKLFASVGCNACHSLQKDQRLVGPSFYGLWTRAGTRIPELSPKAYLYESIVQPNKYVVESFQPNLMPPNYAAVLSAQQVADILAYIERDHAEE